MDGKKIVVWSGGCDSTMLLINVARECRENKEKCYCISLKHSCLGKEKILNEKKARNAILKKLKSENVELYIKKFQ